MDELVVKKIKSLLENVRPYLQRDGGDIEFVEYIEGVVYVRMLGACIGCAAIDTTLKDGIEAMLIENVPEVIEVINVSDDEIELWNTNAQ